MKKVIKKITKINGTSKNLYIQVLDQSLFDDNKTVDEIVSEMNDKVGKDYKTIQSTECFAKEDNSVIVVGYSYPSKE